VLRWTARLVASVLALTWLTFGVISTLAAGEPFTAESLAIATFGLVAIAGAVIAWRRERLGGSVLFLGGVAFAVFAYWSAGRNKPLAALFSGGPMLLAGALFWAAARLAVARSARHLDVHGSKRDGV